MGVNDMLNQVSSDSSMAAFDKMKAKVENLEAQAEVAGELAASSSSSTSATLEDRFKELESRSTLDDELEAMKRQLPGSQFSDNDAVAELPAASIDEEYEKLKRELEGQK